MSQKDLTRTRLLRNLRRFHGADTLDVVSRLVGDPVFERAEPNWQAARDATKTATRSVWVDDIPSLPCPKLPKLSAEC